MAHKAESKAKPRRRRNPELAVRHARPMREGVPADQTNLTPQERALLPDPDWVTEDDADVIISLRRLRRPGRTYTLDEVMHRLGYDVAR
jgi:hypothetical protein